MNQLMKKYCYSFCFLMALLLYLNKDYNSSCKASALKKASFIGSPTVSEVIWGHMQSADRRGHQAHKQACVRRSENTPRPLKLKQVFPVP